MCLYFTSPKYLTFALHFVGQGPLTMYNNFIRAQAMGFFFFPLLLLLPAPHFSGFQLSTYLRRCTQGHFIDESLAVCSRAPVWLSEASELQVTHRRSIYLNEGSNAWQVSVRRAWGHRKVWAWKKRNYPVECVLRLNILVIFFVVNSEFSYDINWYAPSPSRPHFSGFFWGLIILHAIKMTFI